MKKFAFALTVWVVALTASVSEAGWLKSRFSRFSFCQSGGCGTQRVQTTYSFHPGTSGSCNSCPGYAAQAYQPQVFHTRPAIYLQPATSLNGHAGTSCQGGTCPAR